MSSLRELCLAQNAEMVLASCRAIEKECGDFSKPGCALRVEELQSFLLARYGNVTNDVCATAHYLLRGAFDARLLFALESHKYARTFAFTNEVLFDDIDVDAGFWTGWLGRLANVTVLDIRGLSCTDTMMDAICDGCRHLEEFRFDTRPTRGKRSAVTSREVERLLELKGLRVVEDAHRFESLCEVFLKGFFARLLPRLENFSCWNLQAFLLDNAGCQPLRLTHVTIYDVRPEYVTSVLRLCPRLSHLRLSRPYGGIFDDIANSPTNIACFRLDWCSADYVPGLCHFLLNKGDALTSLDLTMEAVTTVKEVILIGECCPLLQHFGLNVRAKRAENPFPNRRVNAGRRLFVHLTSLSLGGLHFNDLDPRIADLFLGLDSRLVALTLSLPWVTAFESGQELLRHKCGMFADVEKLSMWVHSGSALQFKARSWILPLSGGCAKLKHLDFHVDAKVVDKRPGIWRMFLDQVRKHARSRSVRFTVTSEQTNWP